MIKKNNPLRHKYNGICSMIVGSKEYSGAGVLSLLGALKSGASYVKTAIPGKIVDLYSNIIESVNIPIGEREYFDQSNYNSIVKSDLYILIQH